MKANLKQASSDRNNTPSKTPTTSTAANLTDGEAPCLEISPDETCVVTAQDSIYRVVPARQVESWKIDHPQTMRKPPDIEALARLGGLPESVNPYELAYRNKDGSLYAICYGNSTATVTNYVTLGYAKVVDAARGFRAQYSDADACEIRDQVKHLDCIDEEWIEKNILHSARSSAELAAELRDLAIAEIPEVNRWGSVAPVPEESAATPKAAILPGNEFVRVGETWEIAFEGETCRLPALLIGLDYIYELLRCAGETINALNLRQIRAVSIPTDPGTLGELRSRLDSEKCDELQEEWSSQLVLDEETRTEYKHELRKLNEKIGFARDTGNLAEVSNLTEEAEAIAAELRKQTKKTGSARQFSNQQENARTTVSHAIKRAFEEIEKYAPKTALHLRENVVTGAVLAYKDHSVCWKT